MRHFLILVVLMIVMLLNACSDNESFPDGDIDSIDIDGLFNQNCDDGEMLCEDNYLFECKSGAWLAKQDCDADDLECFHGKCVQRAEKVFEVQVIPVSTSLKFELDFSKPGANYLLAPFFIGSSSSNAAYEIIDNTQSADTGKLAKILKNTKPNAKLSLTTNEKRKALQISKDAALRKKSMEIWERNTNFYTPPLFQKQFKEASDCMNSFECVDQELCENGVCKSQFELHFDAWTISKKITASVLAKGDRCALLIDNDDLDIMTESEIADFLDACDNVIVPRAKFFFGDPLATIDEVQKDFGDRNEDGLLHVLFSNKVNEENVWGFFASADFWPDDSSTKSNERDIIYISIPESASDIGSLKATIIHEYQHLLHFVMHSWIPWESGESADFAPTWLDEAFAHLAEEIGGYSVDYVDFVNDYLQVFNDTSLTFSKDSLEKRAMGMLFVFYLFEQSGGATWSELSDLEPDKIIDHGGASFLQAVIKSKENGIKALEEASGKDFETMFSNWLVAMATSGQNATDEAIYNYKAVQQDPTTGNPIGVTINGDRHTASGTKTLYAPNMEHLTSLNYQGSLTSNAVNFLNIENQQELLTATISGEEGLYLAIIRLW